MNNRFLSQKWALKYSLVVLIPGLLLVAALVILFSSQSNAIAQIPEAGFAVQSFRTAVTIALILVGVAILLTIGLVLWLTSSYAAALRELSKKTNRLAQGEVWETEIQRPTGLPADALNELDRSLENLNGQLLDLDRMARLLAAGDPQAIRGRPGADNALSRRLKKVAEHNHAVQAATRSGIGQWNESAGQMGESIASAGQMAESLEQLTGSLVTGLHQQASMMDQCSDALQQSERVLNQAEQVLDEQQQATGQAKSRAEQIDRALVGVVSSVVGVQRASADAAEITQSGTERVLQTINGIDRIRKQVDQLGEKMSALGQGSNEIGSIVGTIEEIASQTNLLAINATIEAAHAGSQAHQLTETLLNRFMIGQARLVRKLIESGMEGEPPAYWTEIASQANIDSIYATDEDGVTIISNDQAGIGFRFPEDSSAQAYIFRQLLKQKDGEICQLPQRRSLDNQVFKYVGVSRRDRPGIVQVGFNTSSLSKFELQIGGFTVVAGEVYQLADRARTATGEIRNLIKHMQKIISEAVAAMRSSTGEVDGLTRSANEAGSVLQEIQESFDKVLQLAGDATTEIGSMRKVISQFSDSAEQILSKNHQQAQVSQAVRENLQSALAGLEDLGQTGTQNLAAGKETLHVLDGLTATIKTLSNRINEAVLATDRLSAELESNPSGGLRETYDKHTTAKPSQSNRLGISPIKPLPLSES